MLGKRHRSKMAAISGGRVLSLCRQFQSGFRISTLPLQRPHVFTKLGPLSPCPQTHVRLVAQCRSLYTSSCRKGLEEFFDIPENWGESTVKSGAPWTAKQLRTKSNEDLHKLWYVLLKEKNMLLSIEQEAKRQRVPMPSPERLRKVDRSMIRLETVVREREDAIRLLQTGQERSRPGAWRKNLFGRTYWYKFKEYPIPWYLNTRYKRKRFFSAPFVNDFIRLRIEQHMRRRRRKRLAEAKRHSKLMEKFPNMVSKA
ncbi:large ribosomal subunit protein uL29m [Paramormyrops kingsleyae]|uniref:large ribosomal subunit protein uL29m n=1 Tax=Paramormyrops kingsleyae TaxID=1676925 RepID=UPI003B96F574